MSHIGIKEGIHDVVQCPDEYKGRFDDDVWVWSESRKEAVRILDHEIIDEEY